MVEQPYRVTLAFVLALASATVCFAPDGRDISDSAD
jgi:hypothetical protein